METLPQLAATAGTGQQNIFHAAKHTVTIMNETTNITHSSGSPSVWQLLPLINILLAIAATVRCVKAGHRGLPLVLWLLLVWLVPVIGPLVTLFRVRHARNTT